MVNDIHDISIFIKAMFVFMFYQTKFTSTCLLKSMQSAAGNQTFNFIPYPPCKPLSRPLSAISKLGGGVAILLNDYISP